jgi:hypothetical protein
LTGHLNFQLVNPNCLPTWNSKEPIFLNANQANEVLSENDWLPVSTSNFY